ncbi:MAG: hypothetical protein K9L85_02785 [Candidatus Peribacteraceae bacterium]|nr:hypothetical protein [Candidatus Peribacteraceae bacterium]
MLNPEIFLIFAEKTVDNDRFLERARELKVKLTPLPEAGLAIILRKDGMRVFFSGRDITARILRSRIIFRGKGAGKNTVIALAKFAKQNHVPFLDSIESISLSGKTCYLPTVKLKKTKHMPTIFCEKVSDLPGKIPFKSPFVIKPASGNRGRGVRVAHRITDLKKGKWQAVLIQPQMQFAAEYRVLVLGQKVLAVAEKFKAKNSLVANFSRGGNFHASDLPVTLKNEATRICRDLGIELGGVDFARIGRTFYFLEVNRACGICGVEESTGVDASGKIIEFLLKK